MSSSPSDPDPHRLDVAAFAAVRGELAGEWPATRLRRLAAATLEEVADAPRPPVAWRAAGERRVLPGAGTQPSLALLAGTEVMPGFPRPPGACRRRVAPPADARASGESHGRSTEQEVAFQARHASRSSGARQARSRHRADDRRNASASSRQPDRFLSRSKSAEDQSRSLIARPGRADRACPPGPVLEGERRS